MPYRLPPMNTLRPFEAAARHQSFKLAAEELHLTPSAISHAVQALERWFGCELFDRSPRGLTLNATGEALLPRVQSALEEIGGAVAAVQGGADGVTLRLSVAPTFCNAWLMPRLARFRARYPEVSVVLDTSHQPAAFVRDGIDVAIRMGGGDWPGLHAECLFRESLVPVCSPAIASELDSLADLADQTLLQVSDVDADWAAWLSARNLPSIDAFDVCTFDSIQSAWSAARYGLGIAVGRLPLVQPEIDKGDLVAVLGGSMSIDAGYWFAAPPEALMRYEVQCFRQWLFDEVERQGVAAAGQAPV